MDLNKLSREELLKKCEELGLKKYKSKNNMVTLQLIGRRSPLIKQVASLATIRGLVCKSHG